MVRSKLHYHIFLFATVIFLVFLSLNSTVQGKYYNDDSERYSIWYPDNWQRTSVDGVDIAFMDPTYDDFRENLNVISIYEFGVRNTKEYVLDACDEGIKEIKKIDPSVNVIKQPVAGQINDHWSATYVFDMKQYGETLRFSQTIIVSQGYSYAFIITCTALPHTFDDYETTFSRSINSFEVLNEPDTDPFFSGLCFAVGMGALVGGIAGGIIFYMIYSKKKKEKESQFGRPPVTSNVIIPMAQTAQPPVTSNVIKPASQTKVPPVQSPPEKTLPPPPPPPPPPDL